MNLTWSHLELNSSFRSEKWAPNSLNYGMAKIKDTNQVYKFPWAHREQLY
jgi:hypothetical protein